VERDEPLSRFRLTRSIRKFRRRAGTLSEVLVEEGKTSESNTVSHRIDDTAERRAVRGCSKTGLPRSTSRQEIEAAAPPRPQPQAAVDRSQPRLRVWAAGYCQLAASCSRAAEQAEPAGPLSRWGGKWRARTISI